jgi:hypothetical protein
VQTTNFYHGAPISTASLSCATSSSTVTIRNFGFPKPAPPKITDTMPESIMNDMEAKQKPKENLEGYEDFSKYIASDAELSIYHCFVALGARNLLYLQAELQVLEAQLQKLDDEDREKIETSLGNRKTDILRDAKSWESFHQQSQQEGRQRSKMAIVLKLRGVMKEYGKLNHSI